MRHRRSPLRCRRSLRRKSREEGRLFAADSPLSGRAHRRGSATLAPRAYRLWLKRRVERPSLARRGGPVETNEGGRKELLSPLAAKAEIPNSPLHSNQLKIINDVTHPSCLLRHVPPPSAPAPPNVRTRVPFSQRRRVHRIAAFPASSTAPPPPPPPRPPSPPARRAPARHTQRPALNTGPGFSHRRACLASPASTPGAIVPICAPVPRCCSPSRRPITTPYHPHSVPPIRLSPSARLFRHLSRALSRRPAQQPRCARVRVRFSAPLRRTAVAASRVHVHVIVTYTRRGRAPANVHRARARRRPERVLARPAIARTCPPARLPPREPPRGPPLPTPHPAFPPSKFPPLTSSPYATPIIFLLAGHGARHCALRAARRRNRRQRRKQRLRACGAAATRGRTRLDAPVPAPSRFALHRAPLARCCCPSGVGAWGRVGFSRAACLAVPGVVRCGGWCFLSLLQACGRV